MTERAETLTSEIRSIAEYWDLIASPVYRGLRVPKGKGRHVLLLPGLFGNDAYIEPMHFWLRRLGYRPHRSRLLLNAGCSDRLLGQLVTRADGLGEGQDKIAIIGHSRGGMLGRALAAHLGDRCSNFIAVGSPVGGMLRMGMNGIQEMASSNSTDIAHAHVFGSAPAALCSNCSIRTATLRRVGAPISMICLRSFIRRRAYGPSIPRTTVWLIRPPVP